MKIHEQGRQEGGKPVRMTEAGRYGRGPGATQLDSRIVYYYYYCTHPSWDSPASLLCVMSSLPACLQPREAVGEAQLQAIL